MRKRVRVAQMQFRCTRRGRGKGIYSFLRYKNRLPKNWWCARATEFRTIFPAFPQTSCMYIVTHLRVSVGREIAARPWAPPRYRFALHARSVLRKWHSTPARIHPPPPSSLTTADLRYLVYTDGYTYVRDGQRLWSSQVGYDVHARHTVHTTITSVYTPYVVGGGERTVRRRKVKY